MSCRGNAALWLYRITLAVSAVFCAATVASATPVGLTINATFDPSLNPDEQAAIDIAIANVEGAITSRHDIAVAIYFTATNSGLGASTTSTGTTSYLNFYNELKAVDTSPDQLTALASLGPAPTSQSSVNPATGTPTMVLTTAEARNLGFTAPGFIPETVNGVSEDFDSEIQLNTSITNPPNALDGGTYSLQSVAAHEIDEVLGVGGPATTLGTGSQGTAAGDVDLFRYSAPGVRSYSASTSVTSYFSIDGGVTPLSYFNQVGGESDYADWQSNPDHAGFGPQIQDAFATPGVDPVLGTNEITALNVIGYQLITPEPSTTVLAATGLLLALALLRRNHALRRPRAS